MRSQKRVPLAVGDPQVHSCQLHVRSYECDAYGHVNNAVYLNYLEFARDEFVRHLGISMSDLLAAGYGLLIARVEIDYRRPATTGDHLRIDTVPLRRTLIGGILRQVVSRPGAEGANGGEPEVVAEAEVTWVSVDARGRPARLPAAFDREGFAP